MKTTLLTLAALAVAMTGAAHANTVALSNSGQSTGPVKVSYVIANKNNDQATRFGANHRVTLKPGQTVKVDIPQLGYQQAGLVVTNISLTSASGKKVSQSFNKGTFGQTESCSYATSQNDPSGKINLWLGQHHLTCQHNNA